MVEIVDEANSIAKVDVIGVRRNINVGLVAPEGIAVGDWVLIHVGFALSKIDDEEAQLTFRYLEGLGQAYEDELDQLNQCKVE